MYIYINTMTFFYYYLSTLLYSVEEHTVYVLIDMAFVQFIDT
jgi:hypothetical protein